MKKITILFLLVLISVPIGSWAKEKGELEILINTDEKKAFKNLVQLFQYDKKIKPDTVILDKQNKPGYIRERIVFNSPAERPVYGFLALPSKAPPPFPCVLQVHPLEGSKYDWWKDNNFIHGGNVTKKLLEDGFAVLALNSNFSRLFNFNIEKGQPNPVDSIKKQINEKIHHIIRAAINYRKAVDYLQSRNEIDHSKFGVIGYSMGGMVATQLTSVDNRIKAAVVCAVPSINNVVSYYNLNFDLFKDYLYFINPLSYTPGIDDEYFLMLMGSHDNLCSKKEAQILYNSIRGKRKALIFFDCGHILPEEYIYKTVSWFQRYLKRS